MKTNINIQNSRCVAWDEVWNFKVMVKVKVSVEIWGYNEFSTRFCWYIAFTGALLLAPSIGVSLHQLRKGARFDTLIVEMRFELVNLSTRGAAVAATLPSAF